jgi:hypothetical protein
MHKNCSIWSFLFLLLDSGNGSISHRALKPHGRYMAISEVKQFQCTAQVLHAPNYLRYRPLVNGQAHLLGCGGHVARMCVAVTGVPVCVVPGDVQRTQQAQIFV